MSAAAAAAPPASDAKPKKSKKLIIIIAAVLLLVLIGGGGAVFMMKKKAAEAAAAAEADGADDDAPHPKKVAKKEEHKEPPTFVPLDPFVVNLADRDADRYAQIGVTLEVADAKFAEEIKAYLPAIRNGVLMVISHKTSKELLERAGKEALARDIMREAVRPMGIEVPDEAEADADKAGDDDDKPKKKKKKKHDASAEDNPIKSVNFSSFIVQ